MEYYLYAAFGLIALWLIIHFKKTDPHNPLMPNILTIFGILGTFIGITWGLFEFDVSNIQESIPKLLNGLRFAFVTSIIAMALSVFFRIQNHKAELKQKGNVGDVSIETFAEKLFQIAESNEKLIDTNRQGFDAIIKALSGEDDSTLLSQLQKMRNDIRDTNKEVADSVKALGRDLTEQNEALIFEFQKFAEHMTEMNQKAIIEALSNVISDFNKNLTEQFGENFKELNSAVEKLVIWQEQYKETIEATVQKITIAAEATENCSVSLELIKTDYKEVKDIHHSLSEIMEAFVHHKDSLQNGMKEFAITIAKIQSEFPSLTKTIHDMTDHFSSAVKDSLDITLESSKAQKEMITRMGNSTDQMFLQLNEFTTHLQSQFTSMAEESIDSIKHLHDETSHKINELIESTTNEIQSSLGKIIQNHINSMEVSSNKISANLNESIQKLDREIGEALSKSLESMDRELGSITNILAKNYTPIAERLAEVVELAERNTEDRGH